MRVTGSVESGERVEDGQDVCLQLQNMTAVLQLMVVPAT